MRIFENSFQTSYRPFKAVFESEIDKLIYKLYDLTEEEIKIVEQK